MGRVAKSRTSSHFVRSGKYTRFADWRFIHRACLNLVPLNGARKFHSLNTACRRCKYPLETLPHVLNHCMGYAASYQNRHNTIVSRLKTVLGTRYQVVSENQSLDNTMLRPDLVITNKMETIIIDVSIPFENGDAAFLETRGNKITKYTPLATWLRQTRSNVSIVPFLVGSLGLWDVGNDILLKKICSKSYATLFRKLCVSDCIKASRDVYIQHLTGWRQT